MVLFCQVKNVRNYFRSSRVQFPYILQWHASSIYITGMMSFVCYPDQQCRFWIVPQQYGEYRWPLNLFTDLQRSLSPVSCSGAQLTTFHCSSRYGWLHWPLERPLCGLVEISGLELQLRCHPGTADPQTFLWFFCKVLYDFVEKRNVRPGCDVWTFEQSQLVTLSGKEDIFSFIRPNYPTLFHFRIIDLLVSK